MLDISTEMQSKLLQNGLDLSDYMLLGYILEYFNNSDDMDMITEDNISYVYISHDTLSEELPIFKFTKQTWKNKLCNLRKNGWILSITKRGNSNYHGSMTYYTLSDKCLNLIEDKKMINTNNHNVINFRRTPKSISNYC